MRCLLLLLFTTGVWAQTAIDRVVSIEHSAGMFASSQPTITAFWPADRARATLIVVQGGEGSMGLTMDSKAVTWATARMVEPLRASMINVVVFDSPYALVDSCCQWTQARRAEDHITRIAETVKHYSQLGKPVYLMGHSLGGISVLEYVDRYPNSVAGLIVSGIQQAPVPTERVAMPTLVMHHEADTCTVTPWAWSKALAQKIGATNPRVEFMSVTGGSNESRTVTRHGVCTGGHHMYRDSYTQVQSRLIEFVR